MKTSKPFSLFAIMIFAFSFLLVDKAVTASAGPAAPSIVYLPLLTSPEIPQPVPWALKPFDVNTQDQNGPSSWNANYGKIPEIIVASDGVNLDVLAQDYDASTPWEAALLHIVPDGSGGYIVTQALTQIPMLDRVMGLAHDAAGSRYYATGVDESGIVDPYYPPENTYRSDIVRIVKLGASGNVLFNIDLDIARHNFHEHAEMIINPMVAATARLAVGGDAIGLVHGINTGPDWNIEGRRHQKALSTRLNATTGAVTHTYSVWVSHSFDQRLFYDGQGLIEHHLGDAYPRYLVFGRNDTQSYPLFHIKGALGENLTATRLGNLALIEDDPHYGYLAVFVSESTPEAGQIYIQMINGPRNVGMLRIDRDDNSIDPSLPDVLTVVSSGTQQTNRLRWLTHYTESSNLHAERPKLVPIGEDQYIVLWEQWRNHGAYADTFRGVYGMKIDDQGNILTPATQLTSQQHLPRGDDAFFLEGRAAWMTGSADLQELYIHFVDSALNYEKVTVE